MRISKQVIEEVVRNAIAASGLEREREGLIAAGYLLAEKTRREALGGQQKTLKLESTLEKLAVQHKILRDQYPGALERSGFGACRNTFLRFAIGGENRRVEFGPYDEKTMSRPSRLVPSEQKLFAGDSLIADLWRNHDAAVLANLSRTEDLANKVRATCSGVRTAAKLLKLWPEAVELLPKEAAPVVVSGLPAVLVSELNAAIGLPMDAEESPAGKKKARKKA